MLNDCVMQPLLTVSVSKGNKVKESMVFSSPHEIHLKCFRQTSMWLQNYWHGHISKLLVNQIEENSNVISSDCNGDDACDDSINYFINSEEESIEKITMKRKQLK